MRQQTANALQARQVGQIAQAKSGTRVVVLPPGKRSTSRNRARPAPGLARVVAVNSLEEATAQGILPPGLAQAIAGQWQEVNE